MLTIAQNLKSKSNLNFSWFTKDARHFQILALGSFLFYGLTFLNWDIPLDRVMGYFFACLSVQTLGIYFTTKNYSGLKSSLITSLSLSLMLSVNKLQTALIVGGIAIASKFLIRVKGKHVFNPVNIAIVASVYLTGDAWISPGQWGSNIIFIFFIGSAALMVLLKCGRIDTSLSFLGTLFILAFFRTVVYKGWPLDHLLHQFSNGTLLLFTFFMITDPMTTPNHPKARLLWGMLLAVISFVLSNWFYLYTAPIYALFLVCLLTPILDKLFINSKYNWYENN